MEELLFLLHNPIPPFPEDLCVVRNLLRGGPLFWDTSLPAVYATGQSSGQRPPDAEDDAELTVEDPVFGG
ncbi:hypothetical protein HID58_091961 [Brassica napus]|uniref:Uncharacterized protein n=1 Tax=Brassica napus TaxID=3708 RepID=A0ABQ7WY18_BRANA|nr:hypothetical protein HID58_091961 [Brassica napus]